MAGRRSADFWQYFPKKNRTVARRSPPDVRRRPGGRWRMAKLPQESADHPANYNCELNLPDRRRMSAGCVLKGCSIGGWPSDFCRIRAPDHRTVIRRSILPYCDEALTLVIDGGWLLYMVKWEQPQTWQEIANSYLNYVHCLGHCSQQITKRSRPHPVYQELLLWSQDSIRYGSLDPKSKVLG